MYRGTTASLEINIEDIDLTNLAEMWVTIGQLGEEVITKSLSEVTIEDTVVTVELTQAETLQLRPGARTTIQVRLLDNDGVASATPIQCIDVEDVIKEDVIEAS